MHTPAREELGLLTVGIKAEHLEMEGEAESPGGTMCRHLQSSTAVQGGKILAGDGGGPEGQTRAVGTRLGDSPRPAREEERNGPLRRLCRHLSASVRRSAETLL